MKRKSCTFTEDEKTQHAFKKTPVVTVFSWCALDGHQRSLCLFVEHMDGCLSPYSPCVCSPLLFMSAEVFPDLIDMKFPDRSSSSRKKHTNKIEIDFNSLIAQGLQRDQDKEAKKQEKKERRRRAQKAAGGPKDLLQFEGNSEADEETRNNV